MVPTLSTSTIWMSTCYNVSILLPKNFLAYTKSKICMFPFDLIKVLVSNNQQNKTMTKVELARY